MKIMNTFPLPRRQALSLAIAIAGLILSSPGSSAADTTVRTGPVGLLTLSVPAAKTQALSIPLKASPVYTGKVSVWTANTIKTTGAGWNADVFGPYHETPCVVRMTSGSASGQYFKITSNTADTLTLDTDVNLLNVLGNGDTYELLQVDTLEELFGATAEDMLTNADASLADNVIIREDSGWVVYYNDGEKWLKQGDSVSPQNATTILPDQGVLFVRRGTTPLNLMITGDVPLTKVVTELPANAEVLLANPFPADTTLNDLGFQKDSSWISASKASEADQVQVYKAGKWIAYYYNGKTWRQENGRKGNPSISKGSAVLIVRRNGGNILHTQIPPYQVN